MLACKNKESSAKEAALEAELADAAAKAKEEFDEAQRDAVRRGCKLKPNTPVFIVEDDDHRIQCQLLMRESMKVPSSATFPNKSEDPGIPFVSDDGCNRTYASWVEGKNAFGVEVRSRYECTLDPRTGKTKLKAL